MLLCMNVAQTVVGMLREVIDSEHDVFVFKLVNFLLATLERGDRENVVRFVQAGGAAVMVDLMVLSAEKVPSLGHLFERELMEHGSIKDQTERQVVLQHEMNLSVYMMISPQLTF